MKVSGYLIHEDEDYAVLGSWLFGATAGRLGQLKVFCKHLGLATSATRGEKAYLTEVLGFLAAAGHAKGATAVTAELFHEFAAAVCGRGGWNYDIFFKATPAPERAAQLLQP